jgi:hypothetical protein
MTNFATKRAISSAIRAKTSGYRGGRARGQLTQSRWTTLHCPPDHTRVSPNLGKLVPSPVNTCVASTLRQRRFVPNPQHLLLLLLFETSLHEDKCPL